jgi:F-box interacting protein
MDAEIWQWLPDHLVEMILGRLPMRVLGKMSIVCKQWNDLLSSRDALQVSVPNWSLHSIPGFLIQSHWDSKDDVEYWVMEGCGSNIYKVPLHHHNVVDTCNDIFCCCRKGDLLHHSMAIDIPGTKNWRQMPTYHVIGISFSGMTFDSSTRRFTLLVDSSYNDVWGCLDRRRIVMHIYDSETNSWTGNEKIVPDHIHPKGRGIYLKGKFHWATGNLIVAFNISKRRWTEIPLQEGCRGIFHHNLGEYVGKVVLVEQKEDDFFHIWKLNEEEKYEIWCELRTSGLTEKHPVVAVDIVGFIMVIDDTINMSMFNSQGKLILKMTLTLRGLHTYQLMAGNMPLPGIRTSQRLVRVSITTI